MTQHYRLMRAVRVQYLAVLQAIKVRFTRDFGGNSPAKAREGQRARVRRKSCSGRRNHSRTLNGSRAMEGRHAELEVSSQQLALWSSLMRRTIVLIASAAINASTILAVASECTLSKDIDASRTRWAVLRSQPARAADNLRTCRAYAASFYESVTLRQAAARCVDRERNLAALDSEIKAFNDLLATKCGN